MGDRLAGSVPDGLAQAEELAETDPRTALSILDALIEPLPAEGAGAGEAGDPAGAATAGSLPGRLPLGAALVAGRADWARGRALRLLGRHQEATARLEAAVAELEGAGASDMAAQASVTLAAEWANEARFDEAIGLLDRAAARLAGAPGAVAVAQKALVLQRADRSGDALPVWDEAIGRFEGAGMGPETASARHNRGLVRFYRGDLTGAEVDLTTAEHAFRHAGLEIRAVDALHNQGLVHAARGDLPRAFEAFDAAQAEASRLGPLRPQTLVDRAQVALDAGLIPEGRALAEQAVERLQEGGFRTDVPEACLLAARACDLDGDAGQAARWASKAASLFAEQDRPRWALLARVAAARAEAATGSDTATELHRLAEALRVSGWNPPATEAETAAVALLVEHGRLEEAGRILAELSGQAASAPPRTRLEIRLAQAGHLMATGQQGAARRAVAASVAALRQLRATMGSVELRSGTGGRSDAVIGAALALASATRSPDAALWAIEAVRYPVPAARSEDLEVTRLLGDLRSVNTRIGQVDRRSDAAPPADLSRLRRRRTAIEELLRRRTRHRRPPRPVPDRPIDTGRIISGSSEVPVVEYGVHRGRLYAVVVTGGRAEVIDVADVADARRAVAGLRLALHIAVTDGPDSAGASSLARAASAGQQTLYDPLRLGRLPRLLIAADRTLASTPWALLPDLQSTEITTTPSATWWYDRRQAPSGRPADGDRSDRVVVVAGPALRHAEAEVAAIAAIWPGACVLAGADATIAGVSAAMAGADTIHIAAHASHRGDHPLLSGIRLWDGHLTGYELSNLDLPARLMVLSCCETGMAETAGGIGLSRLVTEQCGVATAVASVSPLSDRSVGPLMVDFHRRLAAGAAPARALVEARNASGGPLSNPSAAGLLCHGI